MECNNTQPAQRAIVAVGVLVLVLAMLAGEVAASDDKPATADKAKIRAVVVVGGHGFNAKKFSPMFEAMADLDFDIRPAQPKDKPHLFDDISKFPYDVIFLYNMRNKLTDAQGANFLKLLDKGVGLFVCHHAIAGFQDWPGWPDLIGARYFLKNEMFRGAQGVRSVWKHDVDLRMHVEDANHPITKGLKDFDINDETYGKWRFLPGNHLLISTVHELSNKQIAWTRVRDGRRVFFMQLGHGPAAWKNKSFRYLLARGIRWTAGRLDKKDSAPAAKAKDVTK